jgi:molybdopterin/thiamine biosynthesis adenylyltransferase
MQVEDRYARHRLIEGWNQDRIGQARVLVAGAGAIGNEVIKLLALLGFGRILIVDFDRVELSNLSRSQLFREADIGRPKAEAAAERAREINPAANVKSLHGDLRFDVGQGVLAAVDVAIGCLDNLDARLALNRACLQMNAPWLNGAIEVDVAEVSLFRGGAGACFECAVSPEMWERRSKRYSCTGLRAVGSDAPAPATAVAASIAAAYLVQEALHIIHAEDGSPKEGLGYGEKLTVNLKPYDTRVYKQAANPDCLAHETMTPIVVLHETPRDVAAVDLLARSGGADAALELGYDLLVEMRCAICDTAEPVLQPLERAAERLTHCARCGRDSRRPETVSWIDGGHALAGVALADLGVPDHQVLCVKSGNERVYYQLGGRPIW